LVSAGVIRTRKNWCSKCPRIKSGKTQQSV
jgi:hypothetical protein